MSTYLDRLNIKLVELKSLKDKFISSTDFFYHNPNHNNSGFYIIGAEVNHWGTKHNGHEASQMELKLKFNEFIEYFSLVEHLLAEKKVNEIKKTTIRIRSWIEKKGGAPGSDIKTSIKRFDDELVKYESVINLLNTIERNSDIILVPDTNALICHPELNDYALKFPCKINILIPSTVISELDRLKIFHNNKEVREKVKSIITRLKGYKRQGDIINDGVILSKSILLKLLPIEPKFNDSLPWLDPTNMDDRIIVTILDIELHNLTSEVILITGDLNLQNKATLAGIKYMDVDEIFE